jgi:hypothetical protein
MDTFYFSHDYTSRSDDKIKRLLRKHGMQGYGIFWAIVEDLYINENKIAEDYEGIAYDLRIDAETAKSIIQDFELFQVENGFIRSNAINVRIEKRNIASKKGRESADKRWDDDRKETRIKANETIFYIIKVYSESEQFIKAGITTESISRRYSGKLNGYKYDVIYQYDIDIDNAINVENELVNKFERYTPLIKFPGYKECYNIEEADEIKDFAMLKLTFRNDENSFRNAKNDFRNAIKESKVKESKVNETKEDNTDVSPTAPARVKREVFRPPTLEEVKNHATTTMSGSRDAPEAFHDYYTSNGWKVGRNPMKDWKAAYKNWIKRESNGTYKQPIPGQQFAGQTKSESEFERWKNLGTDLDKGRRQLAEMLGFPED